MMLLLLLSRFSHVQLCATHRRQPTRLPCPWDYPGKNTGVGCHFLLQCRKVKSESEVTQSCLTLSDPMDCSLPGSSILRIFQARVLEWGAIAFSDDDSIQVRSTLLSVPASPRQVFTFFRERPAVILPGSKCQFRCCLEMSVGKWSCPLNSQSGNI